MSQSILICPRNTCLECRQSNDAVRQLLARGGGETVLDVSDKFKIVLGEQGLSVRSTAEFLPPMAARIY